MKVKKELQEYREKENSALFGELKELNTKLTQLQFKASFKKLKNYQEIKMLRKKIARIWTVLGEKTLMQLKEKG